MNRAAVFVSVVSLIGTACGYEGTQPDAPRVAVGVAHSVAMPTQAVSTVSPASAATGVDDGPQDGTFDSFTTLNLGSVNNNGFASFRTAFEFDLSDVPAGAQVNSATLSFTLGNPEGTRSIQVHGFAGDGTVGLADFARDGLVGSTTTEPGSQTLGFDVTSFVAGLVANGDLFAGFSVREAPANASNFIIMSVDLRTGFSPVLSVVFTTEPVEPQPIVFSNFGPTTAFDAAQGWTINGFLGPGIGQQAISQQFTPTGDARLGYVQVALKLSSGGGTARAILQEDAGGLPGPVIEETRVAGVGYAAEVFTAMSVLHPALHRGTPYWLTVAAGGDGVLLGWQWNTIGDVSRLTFAGTQGGGPTGPWGLSPSPSTRSAFLVAGTGLTTTDATRLVIGRIEFLSAYSLFPLDAADGLRDKLTAVLHSIDRGATGAACNQLRAFLNQVRAQVRAHAVSASIGEELITAGNELRTGAGCD